MAILSRSINGTSYRIRSIAMSTLALLPLIVVYTYLLNAIGKNLNEDAQVPFFFLGIPIFVGCTFMATMLMYRWLYHQDWPRETYRTAGLLASVISIPMEWLLIYTTSHFSLISERLSLWVIILGACLIAIPVTWMLFIFILHRRYNDVFTW